MGNSNKLVIVLSRNYSTGLGVIRALGRAGYTVDLIASVKQRGSSAIPASSKYVRNCIEVLDERIQGNSGDNILNAILSYKDISDEKITLFPCDDFTASVVSANYDKLLDSFVMPHVVGDFPKTLVEAMDKSVQSKLAKAAGMLVPLERNIDLSVDISIPADISYPCFVKPNHSVTGSKSEIKVCKDENELLSHVKDMKSFYSNRSILIQEHLKIDKEYDISGLCLDDKVIVPGVLEKIRIAQYEPGVTMSGRMCSVDVLGDTINDIISLLKSIRYYGMFDMELFRCGDRIYFNEINLRSGGPNYSYMLSGVNLPDIFVKELSGVGHNPSEEELSFFDKTFVYEKVAWEDYIHSFMTKSELKDCINGADFTLLADDDDVNPGKQFFKRIRLSALKHKIFKLLGRE